MQSTAHYTAAGNSERGFTLIELMVVLSLVAILASIAVPYYWNSVIKAHEAVLLEDLFQMRDAIDKYYGDNGEYPSDLLTLADKKYIRGVPIDPITNSDETWVEEYAEDGTGIFDVHSGSDKIGRNDIPYREW